MVDKIKPILIELILST